MQVIGCSLKKVGYTADLLLLLFPFKMSLFTYGGSLLQLSTNTTNICHLYGPRILIGLFYVMAKALWLLAYCSGLIIVIVYLCACVRECVRARVFISLLVFAFFLFLKTFKMAITHQFLYINMQCAQI